MAHQKVRKYDKLELAWVNKDQIPALDEEKKDYIWVPPNDSRAFASTGVWNWQLRIGASLAQNSAQA